MLDDPATLLPLAAFMAVAAALYSTSGHGGATAYLAILALWSVPAASTRPLALVLNIVVAGLGTLRLGAARAVPWRPVALLLCGSVPAAFLGARAVLPPGLDRAILGATLLLAAGLLWRPPPAAAATQEPLRPAWWVALGAALGALSGVTGIGGGIFLSPIVVLGRLCTPRQAAGAAAVFIVANSAVGLLGLLSRGQALPVTVAWGALVAAVLFGGALGSWLAAVRLSPVGLRRALAFVLVVSGLKLLGEAFWG